jgi:hypothetical protein
MDDMDDDDDRKITPMMEEALDALPNAAWCDISTTPPQPGDLVAAQLNGCLLAKYLIIRIRDGEGLGHIKRWVRMADDDAE